MNAASDFRRLKCPGSTVRRRPALPSGYRPPDYRVVPVRLTDGTILHVNADDLADPRYVNVRNLNPDGTVVPGRAGLQARAVFDGADALGRPYYGSEYLPEHAGFAGRHEEAGFSNGASGDAVEQLFQQAERAGIRLTPGLVAGLAQGDPRAIAYLADMIAGMGGRPAVEPRYEGGEVKPGGTYTVNERGPEAVVNTDGKVRQVGDGRPSIMEVQEPGYVVPVNPPPATPTNMGGPKYSSKPSPELQQGQAFMRRVNADQEARNLAAAKNAPAGEQKIEAAATGALNLVKDTGNFAKNMVVGLGKTAATMGLVANEATNPVAQIQGRPMTDAAGQALVTGLASMGASTNHFLSRFTESGKTMRGHLDHLRAELDKTDPVTNIDRWLKEQDKTLQRNLPAWYATARPLGDGRPTGDDIRMAGQRGLTNPESRM